MRPEPPPADVTVALSTGSSAATDRGSVALPGLPPLRIRLPRVAERVRGRGRRIGELSLGRRSGQLALTVLVAGTLLLVAFATGRTLGLVPRSPFVFPAWEAGPLHDLFAHLTLGYNTLNYSLSVFLVVMTVAFAVAMLSVSALSMRTIAVAIVLLHVLLLLAPPMQLTDLFNYLGYARLGAVHHLNPYVSTIRAESYDPVVDFTTWNHLQSPYGPLFTAITYPVALLPLSAAYWTLKLLVVAASLGTIALVHRCAKLLGRDPRFAVAFVALNPIYLFYAVGAFHNDFFMLVPTLGAVALLLSGRDRSAGAVLMLAVAIKFTAVLLLPFLLIAVWRSRRSLQLILGAALAALPLVAMSLLMFGPHLPNLHDQSSMLTPYSVPNVVGWLAGIGGGTTGLLHLADVALVLIVLAFLWRRPADWIAGAGWATLALICTLSWLMPWYIVWALPFAALGSSVWLRRAVLVFTVFLLISFMPVTGIFTSAHNINLLNTPAGQASQALQNRLAN